MKLKLIFAALCLTLCNHVAAELPRTAPDWTLRSTDGDLITLSEVAADQPVILLFWATWCPYCKALMPHIQSIRLEHGDSVRILAVHFRDDDGDPIAFIENAGYDFTVLPDGGEVAKLNGMWGTPGVLLVDAELTVQYDRYELPKLEVPDDSGKRSHSRKAGLLAPYWASELRKSLDSVLAGSSD
ncbi:MAG: TlpA disulfide reductase family protein [Woeseiaceae bacterium]|nr:TlpA disulfide reductase family protein [Woeseiaceae bacterium]